MFFGFALVTLSAILIDAGWTHRSILQVIRNESSNRGTTTTNASAGVSTATQPNSGTVTGGGSSVAGHPELKPGIAAVVNTVRAKYPALRITSTTGGTHAPGSYHYQGRAADLAADSATMNDAALWIARSLTPRLAEGIHNPGLSVKNGKSVGVSLWGAVTWSAHTNHIHLAV